MSEQFTSERRGHEHGFVLIVVAGLLVVLLGFTALGISVGYLYSARTTAQEIGDAAALAGALTFITNPAEADPEALAEEHATEVAVARAEILGVALDPADVSATATVANRRVQVDIQTVQPTFVTGLLGITSATVGTTSIAEAASDATGAACTKPWFIPNNILDPDPNSPAGFCGDCASATDLLIDPNTNGITAFAEANLGTAMTLTPESPQTAIGPGQFYNIQLGPDQPGGDDIRLNIAGCFNQPTECFEEYSVKTGRNVGPNRQGVEAMIGTPNQDGWIDIGRYETPAGSGIESNTSRSLAIAPVWDTCSGVGTFCDSGDFPQGTNVTLRIVGYALIFVDGMQGTVVNSHLVNVTDCATAAGGGGGGGAPEGSPVFSLPLRLVRTPPAG